MIDKILKILKKEYPDARCDLEYSNAWELLVSTMLSAQSTDKAVILVTPELFRKYKTINDMAKATPSDVEGIIKKVGLSFTKSVNIVNTARILRDEYGSIVPSDRKELVKLPGVGRKTANVVLGNFFNVPAISVDTHVIRISYRLGLTKEKNPLKIEMDLMKVLPKNCWIEFTHLIIRLGRKVCLSKPRCEICKLSKYCPKINR